MQLEVAGLISSAAITVECDLRQVVHTHCLCYQRKPGNKQARYATHK